MYNVYFYNKSDLLLCQLMQQVPAEGQNLTIKGRKIKVSTVQNIDEKYYVDVTFEVKKGKANAEPAKKKK
ncbi:MAG: hypothetical protein LPK26_20305 [Bacillaceae bacterium]|uniref:Preprotein translocase subunit SecA n=1 Tax=Alkalihalobacterium chitinilyticum TaxID=2980103 RepID=A0ABT5VI87_9BACI|nr:hypothetical protein [Alkalihalobacterium chitinilyticum]MDE5415166.1 hypothetical protein [Alkalihalobacterium chitinilyticum]MEB1809604.1 hypothetical protein [Bacillaceae bacterium]